MILTRSSSLVRNTKKPAGTLHRFTMMAVAKIYNLSSAHPHNYQASTRPPFFPPTAPSVTPLPRQRGEGDSQQGLGTSHGLGYTGWPHLHWPTSCSWKHLEPKQVPSSIYKICGLASSHTQLPATHTFTFLPAMPTISIFILPATPPILPTTPTFMPHPRFSLSQLTRVPSN